VTVKVKRILAATDLSSGSVLAVDRGFLLARSLGAQYTVIHAINMDSFTPLRELFGAKADAVGDSIVNAATEQLKESVSESLTKGNLEADLRIENGDAAAVITHFAENTDTDLVVLGAHGSGFLQRMLIGSTASRLLRKSKRPVLVVKQEPHRNYKRVLLAIDFSPASEYAIQLVRELVPAAHIVLLHTFDVPLQGQLRYAGVNEDFIEQFRAEAQTRATHKLRDLAAAAGLSPMNHSEIVAYGDATRNIIEYEEKMRCDLIVLGKHGTHVTEELLFGSTTKRVLAESNSDVLVVVDERQPKAASITP